MSNSINTKNQSLQIQHDHAARQWETIARCWLSSMPEGKTVTASEVEAWINSNLSSLPDEFKSLTRPELYEWVNSIAKCMRSSNEDKDSSQVDPNHARFQRTDQWMPVYSWLESLDTDELIKSNDIIEWLSKNTEVKEQLYSRHSRYHLMHYIKKCHVKILKRKDKKKGLQSTDKASYMKAHKTGTRKLPVPLQCTTFNNLPKDSELYAAKRNEAFHKYEILVELEKQLSTVIPNRESANTLKEP